MIEFGVLGPLLVQRDTQPIPIPSTMTRRLLGVLLARTPRPVPIDTITDQIWLGAPPPAAKAALHAYISRLRPRLDADRIRTCATGYALHTDPDDVDARRFEHLIDLAAGARSTGHPERAHTAIRQALDLWRGSAYEGMLDVPDLAAEAGRLEDLRICAIEDAIQFDVDGAHHAAAVNELIPAIARHPYRERLRAQHMLALYRLGRRADALAAYRDTYRALDTGLGIKPGPDLQDLHRRILEDDPTLTTPGRPAGPTLLPRPATAFIGRDQHLRDLDTITSDTGPQVPMALLTGGVGTGKTALAVWWARSAARRFPDGQILIDLRGFGRDTPLTATQALALLLRALGADPQTIPVSEADAILAYRRVTAGKRLLLVLDNANGVDQVRPLLPVGPGAAVVVTSRNRLAGLVARDDARRIPVDALPLERAVDLLRATVGPRIETEPHAATALATACAGLPLALRITAAVLADEPERTVAAHVTALTRGDRLPQLALEGDPDSSVRIALDQSYERLDPDAQRAFRLLGLVPGPDIGVPAAAALTGWSLPGTAAVLARLTAAHLLADRGDRRAAFHDLIAEYARDLCLGDETAADREAAYSRLLTWFVAQADRADHTLRPAEPVQDWVEADRATITYPDPDAALDWFEREGEGIIALIRSAQHTRPEFCWQLAYAASTWFRRRRSWHEWADVFTVAAAAAEASGAAVGRYGIESGLGVAHSYGHHPELSLPHFVRGLAAARASGDRRTLVHALRDIGGAYGELLRVDDAIAALGEAEGIIAPDPGLAELLIAVVGNTGYTYLSAGRYEESLPYLYRALAAAQQAGSLEHIASVANNITFVLRKLLRAEEAHASASIALDAAIAIGHRVMEFRARYSLGQIAVLLGRLDDARAALLQISDIDPDDYCVTNLRGIVAQAEAADAGDHGGRSG